MYLYHYTSPFHLGFIFNKEIIFKTPYGAKFNRYGEGVYFTSLPPSVGRRQILYNNYRKKFTKNPYLWEKTAAYICIDIKYLRSIKVINTGDGSDEYILPRKNVYLYQMDYTWGFVGIPLYHSAVHKCLKQRNFDHC
ncbi:hypothetical protein CHUAL_004411 [Chamberlinius hualienensis]